MTTTSTIRREALARQHILDALANKNPQARLSDVFFDAQDRDSNGFLIDHGFDADDLAAVLLPILTEYLHLTTAEDNMPNEDELEDALLNAARQAGPTNDLRMEVIEGYRMEVVGLLNMLAEELTDGCFDKPRPPKWIRDRLADLGAIHDH